MKKSIPFYYLLLFVFSISSALGSEIKSEKGHFCIIYEDSKHKFLAQSLYNVLELKTPYWNKQLGLHPLTEISIYLCKNEIDINAQKLPFDAYFIPNNKNRIFLLIDQYKPIDSVQNWFQILFYQWAKCLFRQHKIPNHILCESSYLVWLTHAFIGWGDSSLPINLSSRIPFLELKNGIKSLPEWYEPQVILENQITNDMETIKAFTLLLITYHSEKKQSVEFLHQKILMGLKSFKPWQELVMPEKWNGQLFSDIAIKRDIYIQHLQNFNYPRNNLTWNTEGLSILREVIRIYKKSPELANTIFNNLSLYPIESNLFCEFGIFLNPKEKGLSEHLLWMEFYLLNQIEKSSFNLSNKTNLNDLILSFPERERVNDQIKLLQFMTYYAMKAELQEYLSLYDISSTTNTILLNHAYAVEILLHTKDIKSKIKLKFQYTANLLWPTIKKFIDN